MGVHHPPSVVPVVRTLRQHDEHREGDGVGDPAETWHFVNEIFTLLSLINQSGEGCLSNGCQIKMPWPDASWAQVLVDHLLWTVGLYVTGVVDEDVHVKYKHLNL